MFHWFFRVGSAAPAHTHPIRFPPPLNPLPSLLLLFHVARASSPRRCLFDDDTRYLPGIKLPKNVVAQPDITQAVNGATTLVFVTPHQVSAGRLEGRREEKKRGAQETGPFGLAEWDLGRHVKDAGKTTAPRCTTRG